MTEINFEYPTGWNELVSKHFSDVELKEFLRSQVKNIVYHKELNAFTEGKEAVQTSEILDFQTELKAILE